MVDLTLQDLNRSCHRPAPSDLHTDGLDLVEIPKTVASIVPGCSITGHRLLVMQRHHRIHPCRPPCGKKARSESHGDMDQGYKRKREGAERADSI